MEIAEILPFIAGIASFLVAGGLVAWIVKQPAGTKEMMDISNAVKEGASAFLKREMKIIVPVEGSTKDDKDAGGSVSSTH